VDKGYHNGNCPMQNNITTIVAHPTPGKAKKVLLNQNIW
jgi:hypothetical protein